MKKKAFSIILVVLIVLISGCSTEEIKSGNQGAPSYYVNTEPSKNTDTTSDKDTDAIFEECKVKSASMDITGANKIDTDCLMKNADTIAQCRAYQGREIYSYYTTKYFEKEDVDKCIKVLAIKINDVNMCEESGSAKESCYLEFAIKTQNPELCLKADKELCYGTLAINMQNPELCTKTSNSTKCYKGYGIGNCTSMGFGASIISCVYNRLRINNEDIQINDASICGIWEPYHSQNNKEELCVSGIGAYMQDISTCDKAGSYKVDCYMAIARSSPTFSLKDCDKVGVGYVGCYATIATRDKNPEICSELPEGSQESCIQQIVDRTQSYASCVQIIGTEDPSCVRYFAPRVKPEEYTLEFCDDLKENGYGAGGPPVNQCFYEVATRNLDINVCNRIQGEETAKNDCIERVQHVLNTQ